MTPLLPAILAVDHLLLGVFDLDRGCDWVERRTGVRPALGGSHPGAGTRNALLSLGERCYLEVLGPDPAQPGVQSRLSDLLRLPDQRPRLVQWAVATSELDRLIDRARVAGVEIGDPKSGSRARPDGSVLRWRAAALAGEAAVRAGATAPFVIEWEPDGRHPAAESPGGCTLTELQFAHPDPESLRRLLSDLGIAADVSHAAEPRLSATLTTPRGTMRIE